MANEKGYRPTKLDDLSGQDRAKKMLKIYIKAAQMKKETLDHVLISGASGTGKTTVAYIIANELGMPIKEYSGPAIKNVQDAIDILCDIKQGDVIFIDEIHALSRKVQEQIYFAAEQFVVDINDPDYGQTRQDLPHFTLIGATTSLGGLEEPCINRFPIQIQLEAYSANDMTNIVKSICKSQDISISTEEAEIIGGACRNVPRIANSYVRRINDFALVLNNGMITKDVIYDSFMIMGIDKHGFNSNDIRYIELLASTNKAMGIDNISVTAGLDKVTIANQIEPYLMQNGYVMKAARGRRLTEKGMSVAKEIA